jgi:RNA polymerase sigma-70 factor (ECF subfamily)
MTVAVPGGTGESSETNRLLDRAARGDHRVLEPLLARHRDRLLRMVALRLDQRLRKRIDPSDVIQEAYLEASARLEQYLRSPTMPFYLWLRFLAGQKIVTMHRHHLGVGMRDAGREVAFPRETFPEASSAALAAHFLDRGPRPSEDAIRAELREQVRRSLDSLPPLDREVLALRHFEQLSRSEIATVLGISEAAAGKRYLRALEKLKQILGRAGGDSRE